MKHRIAAFCVLLMLGTAGFAVAESPFVGTWKLNQAKSHLTGGTMKFSPAANNMIRLTVAEGSYTFKPDGHSYPALFGDTENWTKLSGQSWKTIVHGHGGFVYTDTMKISDDGKSLTATTTGTNPNGSAFDDTTVYTRAAGDKGLMGTWRTTKVKMSSDNTLEFAANGNNGLTWNLPTIKATLDAKFDGKDYAPTGPTVPDGLTLALTKTGPRSFSMVEKMKGKPLYKGKYTVSPGGKTLTEVGMPVGQAQPQTSVYDKQ